jgi:hypothetical protein
MHHGGAAVRRAPDRSGIQEIIAVNVVITGNVMAEARQMSRHRGTHLTAMPRDQNPHDLMIGRRPAAGPTGFADEKGPERRDVAAPNR